MTGQVRYRSSMQQRGEAPLLSIIVPHYGDSGRTMSLVSQLVTQETPFSSEIIVVDDCSPVPMPQMVGVRRLRLSRNSGFGTAANAGAAVAEGQLIMILNSDLDVPSDFVREFVHNALPLMPAICSARILDWRGIPQHIVKRFPSVFGVFWLALRPLQSQHDTSFFRRLIGEDERAFAVSLDAPFEPRRVPAFSGAAFVLLRSDFTNVGGFDERFFMYSEDIDLQRRLLRQGVPCYQLHEPAARHLEGGSSNDVERWQWMTDSSYLYHWKWGGATKLLALRLVATGVNFVWDVARWCAGRDAEPLATFAQSTRREFMSWSRARTYYYRGQLRQ